MTKPIPASGNIRLFELDGLRGWASLSVLLFHIFWEMFGNLVPSFRNPLTAALFNGQMAVAIFFVLSGEALSTPYWASGNRRSVVRQVIKRYPRLTLPIFFSCLLVFILMTLGLSSSREAATLVNSPDWLGSFLAFSPDLASFLKYATFDVYAFHTEKTSYNPFLWTMKTEIIGSFIVFCLLLIERHIRFKTITFVAVSIAFFYTKSFICLFLIGMVFGRLHMDGTFLRLRQTRWVQIVSPVVILAVFAFIAHKQAVGHSGIRPYSLAATAFVFAIHANNAISDFLQNRISLFLGKISFPLYLVHFPVIISLTSGAVVFAHAHDALTVPWVTAIAVTSTAVSLVAAIAFERLEGVTRRVCDALPG